MKKWNCELKNPPQKITVGTKLQLSCDGEIPTSLGKKNLSIIFPKKENAYKLHFLKTLNIKEGHIDLEVTSYKTGFFEGSFTITDGLESFVVENFSFQVDSVLSKNQQVKPHGAFGPWKEPIPFSYFLFCGLTLSLFLAMTGILFYRFFQRKKLKERIATRLQGRWPSKIFIKNLRRLSKHSSHYISDLEVLFKIFLENLFCIPTLKKSSFQILHSLRKYETSIYKKHSNEIRQLLKELKKMKEQKVKQEIHFQLEKTCKDLVFLLEEEKK